MERGQRAEGRGKTDKRQERQERQERREVRETRETRDVRRGREANLIIIIVVEARRVTWRISMVGKVGRDGTHALVLNKREKMKVKRREQRHEGQERIPLWFSSTKIAGLLRLLSLSYTSNMTPNPSKSVFMPKIGPNKRVGRARIVLHHL
jgi:hypothetical protein